MSTRSAGPLTSKLRKKVFARKRARISSKGSYDSCEASTVSSVTSEGRAGNWMAGPRVRVRSGRSAKFPERRRVSEAVPEMQRGGVATN